MIPRTVLVLLVAVVALVCADCPLYIIDLTVNTTDLLHVDRNTPCYDQNTCCMWAVLAPTNKFLRMSLCGYINGPNNDVFQVFNGFNTTDPANLNLTLYSGSLGGNVYSTSNAVTILYKSDFFPKQPYWNSGVSFFEFDFTVVSKTVTYCNNTVPILDTPASGSRTLTEPISPSTQYPNNKYRIGSCAWRIRAPPGKLVSVSMQLLALQYGDSLAFFDGVDASAPLIAAISDYYDKSQQGSGVCDAVDNIIRSTGSDMYVVLNSGPTDKYYSQGFSFQYSAASYPLCSSTVVVPVNLTSFTTTTLQPKGAVCQWLFQSVPGYVIRVSYPNCFNWRVDTQVNTLQVYDGASTSSPLLYTSASPAGLNYQFRPPTTTSTSNNMMIALMGSDYNPASIRLSVRRYKIGTCASTNTSSYPITGGTATSTDVQYYVGPLICNYTLTVNPNRRLQIRFSTMDLAAGDSVFVVGSNSSTDTALLAVLNGTSTGILLSQGTTVNVIINIRSTGLVKRGGVAFTASEIRTNIQCTGGIPTSTFTAPASSYGTQVYSNGLCIWNWTVTPGHYIKLNVQSYDFATNHYLSVQDGVTGTWLANITGTSTVDEDNIYTESNRMIVIFDSRIIGSTVRNGFTATWSEQTSRPDYSGYCNGVVYRGFEDTSLMQVTPSVNNPPFRFQRCEIHLSHDYNIWALLLHTPFQYGHSSSPDEWYERKLPAGSRLQVFDGPNTTFGMMVDCNPTCVPMSTREDRTKLNVMGYGTSSDVTILYTAAGKGISPYSGGPNFEIRDHSELNSALWAYPYQYIPPSVGTAFFCGGETDVVFPDSGADQIYNLIVADPYWVAGRPSQFCAWRFSAPAGFQVEIDTCRHSTDFGTWTFYDGLDASAPVAFTLATSVDENVYPPPKYVMRSGRLYATFSGARLGNRVLMSTARVSVKYTRLPPACDEPWVFNIFPNVYYPNVNYPFEAAPGFLPGSLCTFIFKGPEGYRHYFEIDYRLGVNDTLSIYDGGNSSAPLIKMSDPEDQWFVSSGNAMMVVLQVSAGNFYNLKELTFSSSVMPPGLVMSFDYFVPPITCVGTMELNGTSQPTAVSANNDGHHSIVVPPGETCILTVRGVRGTQWSIQLEFDELAAPVIIFERGVPIYKQSPSYCSYTWTLCETFTLSVAGVGLQPTTPQVISLHLRNSVTYFDPPVCRRRPDEVVCNAYLDGGGTTAMLQYCDFISTITSTQWDRQYYCAGGNPILLPITYAIGSVSLDCDYYYWNGPSQFNAPVLNETTCFAIGSSRHVDLYLPQLQSALYIQLTNTQHNDLAFPNLTTVWNQISFSGIQANRILFPSLRSASTLMIRTGLYVSEVQVPVLESLNGLTLVNMYQLISFTFPHTLQNLACIELSGTTMNAFEVPSRFTNFYELFIGDAGNIVELDLDHVVGATNFGLNNLPQLRTLSIANLQVAPCSFSLTGLILADLDISSLVTTGYFTVSSMKQLGTLYAPVLVHTWDFKVEDNSLVSINMPSLIHTWDFYLCNDVLLERIDACNVFITGFFTDNIPSLSCYDVSLWAEETTYGYPYTPNGCSDQVSGIFGCPYGTVNEVTCFTVPCIQDQIDKAIDDRNISVHIPAGTYTDCSAPLNFRGRRITVYGDGAQSSIVDCQGSGRAFMFITSESTRSMLRDVGFVNGNTEGDGGLLLVDGASPTLMNLHFGSATATGAGGAVAIRDGGAPVMRGINVTNCAANDGGAMSIVASGLDLSNTTCTGNSAARQGGAIYFSSPDQYLTMLGVTLTDNVAVRGGGLFADGFIAATDTAISDNSASQFGGGVMLVPTDATRIWDNFTSSAFQRNAAPSGAGIYSFSANLQLTRTWVTDNRATGDGGGVYAACADNYRFLNGIHGQCGVTLNFLASHVTGNSAGGVGGGVYVREQRMVDDGSQYLANYGASGGGIYATVAALTLRNSLVQNNVAAQAGGGLFCGPVSGSCDLASTMVANNQAQSGAGIYLCIVGCPGYNTTTHASTTTGVIPNLKANSNTFSLNALSAGSVGYGADVATDPVSLAWLTPPATEAISGHDVTGGAARGLTVQVVDSCGQVVTSYSSKLAVSLLVRYPDGTSAARDVVFGGAQTVLAISGIASFGAVSLEATSSSALDTPYRIEARLSILTSVTIAAPVTLRACPLGEGRSSNASSFDCATCPAGTVGVGAEAAYTCRACPPGSFNAATGAVTCQLCPVNTFASVSGSTSCVACASGFKADSEGSTECTALPAAVIVKSADITIPLTGSLAALAIIAILAGIYVWRLARARTMKKYYLDQDSTIRTGTIETSLQRAVKKMIVASSTSRIGGGVYADVYKARYESRWVAMKVLKGEMIGNSTALAEFQRETLALSRVSERDHPGIVKLQFFLQKSPMCIGVEFCSNGSVKAALASTLPIDIKIRMMAEAASGMTVIHSLNIAHLDLKTDNLLLDEGRHVKIADFGISRTLGGNADGISMPTEFAIQESKLGSMGSSDGGSFSDLASVQSNPVFLANNDLELLNSAGFSTQVDSVGMLYGPPPPTTTGPRPELASLASVAPALPPRPASKRLAGPPPLPPGPPPGISPSTDGVAPPPLPPTSTPSPAMSRSSSFIGPVGHRPSVVEMSNEAASAFTPQYVDPARIEMDRPNDMEFLQQSDVYSFAMVMWVVMGQVEPYVGKDPHELIAALKTNPALRPDMPSVAPPSYAAVIGSCWQVDRTRRPTFTDVFQQLQNILSREHGIELEGGYARPNNVRRGTATTVGMRTLGSPMASLRSGDSQ